MAEAELGSILKSIDAAIEVYRRHTGRLTAPEISVKSMLTALRAQVAEQLNRERTSSKDR